ncbi:cyclin-dependent kinase 2-associated 1-like [Brachionus plicatilis]|uniref:Cyclin-dependent kinase 2-associated 1-like n=1 Tax=Brachionus plicatilis TaxID=10195 RepID=A0A3M7QPJ2_BRAPC|nr:cyclin-dependent kinase 2-associated 1-like [Brachionus plicatilis]
MDMSKGQQQRQSGSIKQSGSSASLNKSQSQQSPFDVLSSLGGDFNSAVAALTAAASGNLDSNALAQLNAIAQLNQMATNPKMAAAMMQHFGNQGSPSLPASSSLSTTSANNSHHLQSASSASSTNNVKMNQSRYQQLLGIIDDMGKEIRTCYSGNKNSIERLKRNIASARILVKDCQIECDRNVKQ